MPIPFLVAGLLAASAVPQTYADWTVACDTIRRCEAQALLPEGGGDGWAILSVTRAAGPAGAAAVTVRLRDRAVPAAMRIDAWTVRLDAVDGDARVAAADVAAVLPRLAAARRILLLDARGRSVARIATGGASAALRFIDAAQRRAGGVTAIVARGNRPASAVPAAPAMPTFAAVTPPRTPPAIVAPAEIARMRRTSGCPVEPGLPAGADRHRIAPGTTLVLLSCGAGAYNLFSVPWLVTDRGGRRIARHAPFEHLPADNPDRPDRPMLVNARIDPRTGTLSSFAKARGLGDCGTSADYRWDGARFRTVEQRVMGACRGSTDYLRIRVARAR